MSITKTTRRSVSSFTKRNIERFLGGRFYGYVQTRQWKRRLVRGTATTERDIRILQHFIKDGQTCFDVGANAGAYSYSMSRLVGSTGFVHAFEAEPMHARNLVKVLDELQVGNINVHPFALGQEDGSAQLVYADSSGTRLGGFVHLAAAEGDEDNRTEEVPVRSLDSIAEQLGVLDKINFLKIDTEGAELAILRGGTGVLDKSRCPILCEVMERHVVRYGHTIQDVFDLMKEHRYATYVLASNRMALEPWTPAHRQLNKLFLPEEMEIPEGLRA